ncbi:MAG: gliding motility-associated C-terminal domain-containing protein [Luteibaculum sp.]
MQHWLGKIRSGSYLIAIFSTVLLFFYCYSSEAQTPFAFQGNETGDSWNFTAVTNNLSASYVRTGSGSIRAGGGNNTNCGDCINGSGTGNCSGTHISTEIRFVDKDVSCFTGVQLELYYGNYHPACNGTGWDSGEDLYFQAYHDGVAQTAVMLEDGSANLQVPYKRFTYSVPNGLNSFSFRMYILGNTDRRDEFLFMDDVQLTYTSFGGTATSDETICPNETADLFFDCNTGIQWEESTDNVNWTNAAGASTSQNYTTPALTQTTYYRVRLTDTDPEVYSNVLTVTVQGSCCTPLSGVSIAGDNTICQDEIDTYTASFTNGDGPVSYSWTVNGGTINGSSTNSTVNITWDGSGTRSVSVTLTNACSSESETYNVSISQPTVSITQDPNPICAGEDVDLQVSTSAGASFTWDDDNSSTNPRSISNPSNNDSYSVTALDGNGCENTASINIQVTPLPAAPANQTVEYCLNESASQLSPNGAQYNWYDAGMNPLPNAPTPNTSSAGSTTYFVSETANGCEGPSAEVQVTVFDLPAVVAQASPEEICTGEFSTISTSGAESYVWRDDQSTSDTRFENPATSRTYTVDGIDANGCENSASVTLSVNPLPNVQVTADENPICEGESTNLNASGAVNYTWLDDNSTSANRLVAPTNTTTYTVEGENANGCVNTATIILQVNALPAKPADQQIEICQFSPATQLTPNTANFEWFDENMLALSQAPTPPTDNVGTQTYFYRELLNGCAGELAEVIVEIVQKPSAFLDRSRSVCQFSAVTQLSPNSVEFVWYDEDDNLIGSAPTPPTDEPLDSIFFFRRELNGCSSDRARFFFQVKEKPETPSDNNFRFCYGETSYQLIPNDADINWMDENFNPLPEAPTPNTTNSGDYVYHIARELDACQSDTVVIDVRIENEITPFSGFQTTYCQFETAVPINPGTGTAEWFDEQGNPLGNINPTPQTATAGFTSYEARRVINGCTSSLASFPVQVVARPQTPVVPISPLEYCQDDPNVPVLQPAGNPYMWYNELGNELGSNYVPPVSSVDTVKFYVREIETVNNCRSLPDSVLVITKLKPQTPAPGNFGPYCQFEAATALQPAGGNYEWFELNEQTNQFESRGNTVIPSTQVPGNTTFSVVETINGCSSDAASMVLNVKPKPSAPVVNSPVFYCQNESASPLTANANPGNQFNWYGANYNPLPGVPTPSTNSVGNTDYYVSQTLNGCESDTTGPLVVTVRQRPSFTVNAGTACPGENFPISFSFNGTAPFDVRFIDQANGTAQDVRVSQNPGLIQWSQEGNFTVQLLNDNHCNAINQSSSIQLQRFVAPTVSLSVREDKCARSTFVVADFSGTPNFSFNWIRPGGISQPSGTGALKDSIQVNQVGAVRLSNLSDANCPAANSPSVNVNKVDYAVPSPMVFAPRLCEGGMTTVAISNLEPGTETVLRFNGESYNFTQDRVFDFNDLAVGCYDLEIFAIDPVANCSTAVDRYSDALCVEPNPIADFELEPAVTFDEANRTVFNRSFGASSYAWLVNGENVSTDFNLTYDFGVYESASADVCLEATMVFSNNLMCYDTLCRNLNVEGGAPVYLPNAFTPEVNGVNDTWGASTDGFFDYFNLRVYDRWGALIYTGYSPTDRWDGRYKGSLVSPGVYSYRVDFRYKNTVGEKEILGTVTVLH